MNPKEKQPTLAAMMESEKSIQDVSESEGHQNSDPDGELWKKLMKSIQDIGRQLEYVTSKCDSIESLFSAELMSRRNKMKELCEKLIVEAPKTNGAFARDRLWKYVFYGVINKAKRLKRKEEWTPIECAFVKQHLLGGIGQLTLLKLKMAESIGELNILSNRIGIDIMVHNGIDYVKPASLIQKHKNEETGEEKWVIELVYLFLLNIGDLCRYLTEVYLTEDREMYLSFCDRAQDYYTQAFRLNRNSGMALNQLGNLNLKVNCGLDSVYYFLYSLVSKTPYQGAFTNLRGMLDSTLVYFATLPATFEWKLVDIFTHNFVTILNQFLCDSSRLTKFEKLCQDTVGSFINLLRDEISSLDEGFLFRVMSICIMSVWYLMTLDSPIVPSVVCFSIGMFIHLMERLFAILKSRSKLREIVEIPLIETVELTEFNNTEDTYPLPTSTPSSVKSETKDDVQTSTVTVEVGKQSQRNSSNRRRVLQHRSPKSDDMYAFLCFEDDEDLNDNTSESTDNHKEDSDMDSDTSEDSSFEFSEDSDINSYQDEEDNEDKASGAIVDSSEVSDISYQADVDIERKAAELKLSQGSEDGIYEFANGKKLNIKIKTVLEVADLNDYWAEVEPIVIAALPFIRWLRCSLPVQNAFAASTEKEVLERLCKTLNMFESTNWSVALKQNWDNVVVEGNIEEAKEVEEKLICDWKNVIEGKLDENPFSLELPEDISMAGWIHFNPIMSRLEQKCHTKTNMIVTRIGRVLEFGQWLVGTEEFAVIRSEKTFLVPSVEEFKRHMRKLQFEKFNRRLSRSKEAKLLGHEYDSRTNGITNGNFQRGRRRELDRFRGMNINEEEKIYLVFDLAAVFKHFRIIEKLSLRPKFIIVFPNSIIRALDELKDTVDEGSKVARIANRWLEHNHQKVSNHGILLLKKDEKLPLINFEYPLVHTKESLEFFNVLECCHYIWTNELKNVKQRPTRFFRDPRDNYRILFLTGNKSLLGSLADSDREFQPINACRSTHVFLDRVTRYQNRVKKFKGGSLKSGLNDG